MIIPTCMAIIATVIVCLFSRTKEDSILIGVLCAVIFATGGWTNSEKNSQGLHRQIHFEEESGYYTTEIEGVKEYWRQATPEELETLRKILTKTKNEKNVFKQSINEGKQ